MEPKVYKTLRDAKAERDAMLGWDAVIVKSVDAYGWMIECYELETGRTGRPGYMCEDGYVR